MRQENPFIAMRPVVTNRGPSQTQKHAALANKTGFTTAPCVALLRPEHRQPWSQLSSWDSGLVFPRQGRARLVKQGQVFLGCQVQQRLGRVPASIALLTACQTKQGYPRSG